MYAFRYLLKFRGNNVTRLISLALGLTVGLLVFSYVNYELTFDRFYPNQDRIYKIWYHSELAGIIGMSDVTNAPLAPTLAADLPQVKAGTRFMFVDKYDYMYNGHTFSLNGLKADTCFFDVLNFGVIEGYPHQALRSKGTIMLSESTAKKIFGNQDPMGKVLTTSDGNKNIVAGVFHDIPLNCHIPQFDMLMSFEWVGKMNKGWRGGDSFPAYILLSKGASIAQVESQIPALAKKYGMKEMMNDFKMNIVFKPISDSNTIGSNVKSLAILLSALGFLTILVACMNYVLISISSMVKRSKTIAMLRCNGAQKSDVFKMFLYETLILIIGALIVAIFIIFCFQDQIRNITDYPVNELFAFCRIGVPLVVIILTFLLAGIIPARLFTGISLQAAFKGLKDTRRGWKRILLFVQITCTLITFIFLTVVMLQYRNLRYGDFGYNHQNLVMARLSVNTSSAKQILYDLKRLPEVDNVGIGTTYPIFGFSGQPCFDENTRELLFSCRIEIIDENYVPVMGIKILAGKNLAFNEEKNGVLVNEKYVQQRGWTFNQAVGHIITDTSEPNATRYKIIGVVNNIRSEASGEQKPIVFHQLKESFQRDSNVTTMGMECFIRLHKITPEVLVKITDKIKAYKSWNNYHILVYDDLLSEQLKGQANFRNILICVSVIVLIISIMGLLGYLGDEVRRRNKEIAIRKVNGAETKDIIKLLTRSVSVITIPSIVVGVAVSYLLSNKWLQLFANHIVLSWWIFALGALAVVIIVYGTEMLCIWRAANANPIKIIRTE